MPLGPTDVEAVAGGGDEAQAPGAVHPARDVVLEVEESRFDRALLNNE
jgi:hypothetical protein